MTDHQGTPPFAHALFCDDVRQEVNGKVTYVGVYGPDMLVTRFPVTLPKLCVATFVSVPHTATDVVPVFRLYRGPELEAELRVRPADGPDGAGVRRPDLPDLPGPDAPEHRDVFLTVLTAVGVAVDRPTRLTARVHMGDTVLRAGSLTIQAHAPVEGAGG